MRFIRDHVAVYHPRGPAITADLSIHQVRRWGWAGPAGNVSLRKWLFVVYYQRRPKRQTHTTYKQLNTTGRDDSTRLQTGPKVASFAPSAAGVACGRGALGRADRPIAYSHTHVFKKTEKEGLVAGFLSCFLADRRATPPFFFIDLSATSAPHPSLLRRLSVMDPRGITATRKTWGRFLPHQRANVDQVGAAAIRQRHGGNPLQLGAYG